MAGQLSYMIRLSNFFPLPAKLNVSCVINHQDAKEVTRMSVETVLSIIESASGDGTAAELLSMSYAEWLAFARARGAQAFFSNLPRQTAAWMARIRYLRAMNYGEAYIEALGEGAIGAKDVAFHSAMGKMAAEEAYVAHTAAMAEATAAEGTLVAGAGTTVACIVLPVIAMAAVGVALGAPYYQAREEAKKRGYASGFSKGFVTGLLGWELRFTIDRFWDDALDQNGFDEALPKIRANAHNNGLLKGRVAGLAKATEERKSYLRALRKLGRTSSSGWLPRSDDWMERMRARNVQISYVIDMATAATGKGMIKEG
jgi:hypothetical protein